MKSANSFVRRAPLIEMSRSPSLRPQVVLSLAGHIDHGKSALVRALTGGVVDRLPEEQRRGMTIELGFAHFDADGTRFALIDVPGHESFIHTMVAGASGVDLALLVVAADDSVMPQTREHMAVLDLLGIRHGVVAMTKCDLADREQLELVRLEIADLVGNSGLSDAQVVEVSTATGTGIEELRHALCEAARRLPGRPAGDSRFRMPIDRVFSPAGQGTVVTGTVWRGTARVGDTLELLPERTELRIRRMQSQGQDVDSVSAGERAAINLAGIKATELRRGQELTTPREFEASRRHLVHLRMLADARKPLQNRQEVRLHLGASQATAQVLMEQREVHSGNETFAIVRSRVPVVADYGQPFVLRQLSPARTIGGGTIIGSALRPNDRLKHCLAAAGGLGATDAQTRLKAYIDLRREAAVDEAIESRIGLNETDFAAVAAELVRGQHVVCTPGPQPRYVATERFQQLEKQLLRNCQVELERRRPATQVPITAVFAAMHRCASEPVLEAVLEHLVAECKLVRRGDRIGLPTGAELSHRQRSLLDGLLNECTAAGRTPPTLREIADRSGSTLREIEPLVQVAVDEDRLMRISPSLVIVPDALDDLRVSLGAYFQSHSVATVSELREHWSMTRKHAVPILEFFDRLRITVRSGDVRTAGPRLNSSFSGADA